MFDSLRRGCPRILALLAIGALFVLIAHLPELVGLTGGPMPVIAPLAFGIGLVFISLAAGSVALRILQPRIDAQDMAMHARRNLCTASALVYLGWCILAAAILLLVATSARAAEPPAAAVPLLPVLKAQQRTYWPGMSMPSLLGAQVEQETCISLKSRGCWNPRTELRTSREQGIGLGQLTRTWNKDGTQRFDALAEVVSSFPRDLAGLSWENRYDPELQLRALVLKDLQDFHQVLGAATDADRLEFALSAYNGGIGGVQSDRRVCAATKGCDPGRWFGNVERTSLKAKTAIPGYGKPFFAINREYVANITGPRRARYQVLDA
jgi:hypothetical protein